MQKLKLPDLKTLKYSRKTTVYVVSFIVIAAILFVVIPRRGALDFTSTPITPITQVPKAETPQSDDVQQLIANFGQDYDYAPVAQASGTVRIPVIAYHHIDNLPPVGTPGRELYVSPDVFDQQMAYLKTKNYRTVTTRQYYEMLKSGQNPVQKTIIMTFGDGNLDNYTNAFPILKKYGFVGNFFVISGQMRINPDQLKEMIAAGMVIEGHSMTHMALGPIWDPNVLDREIVQSKHDIEAMTGQSIFAFLFPNCTSNDPALNRVKANYSMAFACGASIDNYVSDTYNIQRVYMYDNLENFKKRLSGIMENVNQ